MSFGVGVGDFIAVGTLIVKIINSLHGAQSEYRELTRELEGLRRALSQVDKLQGRGHQANAVDHIKSVALTCKIPLEEFLAKIQKYDKHLGSKESNDKIKTTARKVQFAFKEKPEANTLRSYLNIHIGIINTLLLQQSFEMLDLASESMDKNHEELIDRIEDSARELRDVRVNAEAQAIVLKENNSILRRLRGMAGSDLTTSLGTLCQTVAKICTSTQQIYLIVLQIKASLPGIDTRFTYFQAPVRVEDILGRVFPFPSECSIEALNTEIRKRFRKGHGMLQVIAGDFEIFNAKDSEQVLTTSGRGTLLPGMSVNMAIILEKELAGNEKCPIPRCPSTSFVNAIGGGRTCSECQVWFDGVSKMRNKDFERRTKTLRGHDRNEAKRSQTHFPDLQEAALSDEEETTEGLQRDSEETSISAFKRIRFQSSIQAGVAAALQVTIPPPSNLTSDTSKDEERFAYPDKLPEDLKAEHDATKSPAEQVVKDEAAAIVEEPLPIRFKDAIGRKFTFPFDICNSWLGMEYLIKEAFVYIPELGPHVADGRYDLLGPKHELITPATWEALIEPGSQITMHMWPIPELPEGGDAVAGGIPSDVVIVEPEKPVKTKKVKVRPFLAWTAGKRQKGRGAAKGKKN